MEQEAATPDLYRVLVVDDRPEIRLLVRTRLRMLDDIDVVGEASNGEEALTLVSALAPDAVVLDLEMPVMRGDEAIPLMRELAPGMRILLYTGADSSVLEAIGEEAQPDALVGKSSPLNELVNQLRALLEMGPHDVLRVVLGTIPLDRAVTAFDTWVGLNVRILDSLDRGVELDRDQLGGATLEELRALMGIYAHLGDNLQRAARKEADIVDPIIHTLRSTGAAARRALLAFEGIDLHEFYSAWNYEVPEEALSALSEMRDRLMEALPASSAEETVDQASVLSDGESGAADAAAVPSADREAAAIDRAAAAIDREMAERLHAAASIDALTETYLRGPGDVELEREIVRAQRTAQPLVLAFIDVDGLKAVNDSQGHAAGDQLLRDVASVLRDQSRDYDVIVRYGGDEFVLALPGMTLDQARERIELVQAALSSSPNPRSVSVGLALLEDEDTLETLIERADDALRAIQSSKREAR